MEESIIKINYNNSEYILVNDELIDGKQIYHFLDIKMIDYLTNDELFNSIEEKSIPIFSLFCVKDDDKYIAIEDKKEKNNLLLQFGMLPELEVASIQEFVEFYETLKPMANLVAISAAPTIVAVRAIYDKLILKTKGVTDDRRDEFIKEQKENFRDIKEKLGIDIDLNQIENKLDNIKVNTVEKTPRGIDAFYRSLYNDVNFHEYDIGQNYIVGKRIRLHETTHYMAGRKYAFANAFSKFLIEGATENLVDEYFNDNTSSFEYARENNPTNISDSNIIRGINKVSKAKVQYNFSMSTTYKPYVSLVKQLEYVTGVKSYDSAINGNNHFFKAIVKELGPIPVMKLCANTNTMIRQQRIKGNNIEIIKKQEKLQDMILRVSFDKKFKKINSAQDAKEYLEELRGFETYRGKITYLKENGELEEDSAYKEYYQSKYEELKVRFQESADLLEEYKYKEQEYNPTIFENEEKENKLIHSQLKARMVEQFDGNIEKIPQNLNISLYRSDSTWLIYKINGKEINLTEETKEGMGSMLGIGENDFEWDSVRLKNPNMNREELIKVFLKEIGAVKESMEVYYTEDELKKAYEIYQEMKEYKLQQQESKNKPKKITFIDRLKNRVYGIFNKNKSNVDKPTTEQHNCTEENKKKSPWDLSNWGEGTKEDVQRKTEQVIKNFNERKDQPVIENLQNDNQQEI